MRINILILALLLCFSMISTSCCSDGTKPKTSMKSGPVFDREIGAMEKDVLKKYGDPKEIQTTPAKELKGELRSVLKSKVPAEDTLVKELYYKMDKKEKIFWLTEQSGNWTVIADVEIPDGVVF